MIYNENRAVWMTSIFECDLPPPCIILQILLSMWSCGCLVFTHSSLMATSSPTEMSVPGQREMRHTLAQGQANKVHLRSVTVVVSIEEFSPTPTSAPYKSVLIEVTTESQQNNQFNRVKSKQMIAPAVPCCQNMCGPAHTAQIPLCFH